MEKNLLTLIWGCVMLALLGASCEKPPDENYPVQNKPNQHGTVTDSTITTPRDSILPPYIEKWIWVHYYTDDGCGPLNETFRPPEDFFGADARAITIDWRDSTYTSQHCRSVAGGYTNYNISGTFSCRDTIVMLLGNPFPKTKFIFSKGITMLPIITDWQKSPDHFTYSWTPAYVAQYQVPNQFACLVIRDYKGKYSAELYFLRITSQNWVQHYEPANKNQSITFNQNQTKNQFNQPNYQHLKTY